MKTYRIATSRLLLVLLLCCLLGTQVSKAIEYDTDAQIPQVAPEAIDSDSTSSYAKLVKDLVNFRRAPSSSGTSLGRIPINALVPVLGEEYDGTYTWYQVNYNGQIGYIRSDMAQLLATTSLQETPAKQAAPQPTATLKPTATPKPKPTAKPQYAFDNVPYVASLGTSISSLILKKGEYDYSGAVYAIQSRLYQMGYLDASEVDGYYDDEIIEAIREFRNKNKLTDEIYDISIFLIDDKTLSRLYDDNAKKGDLHKATDADRSATSSDSSSSKSGSSSKGGHWEWQWQWVWRYLTCFNTSRDCPKCRGLGSYQDLVQEKMPVWVPD